MIHSRHALISLALAAAACGAHADTVATLKAFVAEVKTGQANFNQTVTAPDGVKKKTSRGTFEFSRPNRFRFNYTQPFEQQIVSDGQKVWIYDADLNQASVRAFSQAMGATPAALLAGGSLTQEFELSNLPARDGLEWAQALPRSKDSGFQSLKIGFKGKDLAAIEILDAFGQRSLMQFTQVSANGPVPDANFRFVLPKGADLITQ
jgi:outer membrane lipoprotein carrier protein